MSSPPPENSNQDLQQGTLGEEYGQEAPLREFLFRQYVG